MYTYSFDILFNFLLGLWPLQFLNLYKSRFFKSLFEINRKIGNLAIIDSFTWTFEDWNNLPLRAPSKDKIHSGVKYVMSKTHPWQENKVLLGKQSFILEWDLRLIFHDIYFNFSWKTEWFHFGIPANSYIFKNNNWNTRKRCRNVQN